MPTKYKALFSISVIIAFALGFLASQILHKQTEAQQPEWSTRFYAHVIENDKLSLHVAGIPENDINHRGEFFVLLKNKSSKTAIQDKFGAPISLDDISEGNLVYIEYSGPVAETYPAQIYDVVLIRAVD